MNTPFSKRLGQQLLNVPMIAFVESGYTDICPIGTQQGVKVSGNVVVTFAQFQSKKYLVTVENTVTGKKEMVSCAIKNGNIDISVVQELHRPHPIDYCWLAVNITRALNGLAKHYDTSGNPLPKNPVSYGTSSINLDHALIGVPV